MPQVSTSALSFASAGPSGYGKVCGRKKAADISVMPIAEGASWALSLQPTIEGENGYGK